MENKICPFSRKPCGSECAWYDEDLEHCAVSGLADHLCVHEERLQNIETILEEISAKVEWIGEKI